MSNEITNVHVTKHIMFVNPVWTLLGQDEPVKAGSEKWHEPF